MSTVDFRTRYEGDETELDPATFLDDAVPDLVEANGPAALVAADRLGLPSLTLDVEGEPIMFRRDEDRLAVGYAPRVRWSSPSTEQPAPSSCRAWRRPSEYR